jgi:hypothetical protein
MTSTLVVVVGEATIARDVRRTPGICSPIRTAAIACTSSFVLGDVDADPVG